MRSSTITALDAVQQRMRQLESMLGAGAGLLRPAVSGVATATAPARPATTGWADAVTAANRIGVDTATARATARPLTAASWFPTGTVAPASPGTASPTATSAATSPGLAGVPYAEEFRAAGERWGIDPAVLAAVGWVESRYRPDAVSSAGATGLMQLMPSTAASLGVDPNDPVASIDAAARLLRSLQDRFGSIDVALAAYNVGPGTVARAGGTTAPAQRYVDAVLTRAAALRGADPSSEVPA